MKRSASLNRLCQDCGLTNAVDKLVDKNEIMTNMVKVL